MTTKQPDYYDSGNITHAPWDNKVSFAGLAIPFPPIQEKSAVVADNGGLRDDSGKPRYDLIPPEFMDALAAHYAAGATKYADRNWERGMSYGKCFRALMSHAWKWWAGEKYDVDPKMPNYKAHHMIAVAWNAIACYTYETRKIGKDDRNVASNRGEYTEIQQYLPPEPGRAPPNSSPNSNEYLNKENKESL